MGAEPPVLAAAKTAAYLSNHPFKTAGSPKNRYVNLADWYGQYEAPVLKKFPKLTFPVSIEQPFKGDAITVNLLWSPWGAPGKPSGYFPIYASDAIGNDLYLIGSAGLYKISMPIGLTPTCAISSGSFLVFFLKCYVIVSKRVPLIKTALRSAPYCGEGAMRSAIHWKSLLTQ